VVEVVVLRKAQKFEQGFSLLELLVVVFILSLLAGLIVPKVWLPRDLDGTARQLGGLVQALHDKSRATKVLYRLHFQMDQGLYWVTVVNGRNEYPATDQMFRGRRTLPQGVQFQNVMVSSRGWVREGEVFTQFFPVGRVEPTVIHLAATGRAVSLLVHPVTGSVEVVNGNFFPRGWKDGAM
jgi:general secretion pathway protein H